MELETSAAPAPTVRFFFTLLIFFLLDYLIERANGHLNRHTQLTRHVYYNLTSNSSNHVNNDNWARRRVWRWGWRCRRLQPPQVLFSFFLFIIYSNKLLLFYQTTWGLTEGFDVWSASPVPMGTFVFFFLFSTKFWFFLLDYVYENFI